MAVHEHEREPIEAALVACGWDRKLAAARLSLTRNQLNYRIQKLGIGFPNQRNRAPAPMKYPQSMSLEYRKALKGMWEHGVPLEIIQIALLLHRHPLLLRILRFLIS